MTNSITLVGRCHDPVAVQFFDSGSVVANFTLAVNRHDALLPPDLFNLEIWGKNAQLASDRVKQGTLVGIIGILKKDYWNDPTTGEKCEKFLIRVDRLEILSNAAK